MSLTVIEPFNLDNTATYIVNSLNAGNTINVGTTLYLNNIAVSNTNNTLTVNSAMTISGNVYANLVGYVDGGSF